LKINNIFGSKETVLIEAAVERSEQDLIKDRWCRSWITRWAVIEAKLMLAETRGKFGTLPAVGGSLQLNAADLRSSADAERDKLIADIDDYIVNNVEEYGAGAIIAIG
jgi:uncharacterized protein YlxW (UPF0749 family)